MATAEIPTDRRALESADEWIRDFQATVEESARAGTFGAEDLERLSKGLRETAVRVSSEVVPELDVDAANLINQRLISILSLDLDEADVLDAGDQYLIDLEAIRHVLRDLMGEQQPEALRRRAQEVIELLETWLPSISTADVAALLGTSIRQLQRRRHEVGPASSREQLVARLVGVLRYAWTDAGVIAWFHRPRVDLGGREPIEVLGEPGTERELLAAARSGRVQGGG